MASQQPGRCRTDRVEVLRLSGVWAHLLTASALRVGEVKGEEEAVIGLVRCR